MYLVDDAVIFSRPKSTKYKSLRYELNKIQCLVDLRNTQESQMMSSPTTDPKFATASSHCLLLVSSGQQQRSIYFHRRENLEAVHAAILAKQGFSLQNRLE